MSKVSVILTSYNHAKYLRESIESVLNQTYTDFELIIGDDASTDKSWDIIQSYTDPRIHAYRHETNRMGGVINETVLSGRVSSDYIAIHHSDDVWEPEKLEKQVSILNENPEVGAVFSNALAIGENGEPFEDESHFYYKIFDQPNRTRHEWLNFFFYHDNVLCHPSVLIRKACYDDCGLYRYGLAQLGDLDMWVRLCLKYEIHVMPEKLVRYRVRANAMNASAGNRSDAQIRHSFETLPIYENFRDIKNKEEFLKIFPSAQKYFTEQDQDLGFALGMMALDANASNALKLFGLELLFEALNNPDRVRNIKELYDFISLTGKYDIFSVELIPSLMSQIAEKQQRVQELTQSVEELRQTIQELRAQITEIFNSRTWKLVSRIGQVRVKLLPLGSRREKLIRWVLNSSMTLIRRIKNRLIKKADISFSDYPNWIRKNEPEREQLGKQREQVIDFDYKPLISLIIPVWNTPEQILNETISSVLQQTYENFELCIADGNSNPETQKILSDWAKKDSRIHVKFLDENRGIAVNSNEALSLAQGEFVAFLDHDDLLAPYAFFEVVHRLQGDTTVDLIYSDEDKINESGQRFDPFFKPDFSPDYLRSVNYMTHFLVVRKSLGDTIGWFREGYDGAQDYDLILRSVEKARDIAHIPKILYHWRAWTASTAGSAEAKPYANASGKKALQEHLNRIGLSAHVEDGYSSTFYRVYYQYSGAPLISIIIPNHDHAEDLKRCLDSIWQQTSYPNIEIVLVENGSKEQETFKLYEQLKLDARIRIVKWEQPFNYSRVNNWAVTQANGEVILFLNNDTRIINGDWLEEMLQFAMRPDVGAVGTKLYYPDESIQHAGVIVGLGGVAGHSHKYYPRQHPGYFRRLETVQNISAVTAACLMVRKQIFQEVNGFDENYPLAFGDVDLCLAILKKGYLNVWTPYASLYHFESKTRSGEDTPEKKARFKKEMDYFKQKWAKFLLQGDPYYNPNLSLDYEDFRLKE